ncbi:hypothetical protein Cpir12675_000722 [Ceratocystis pirilliformis]|uniref:Glycosyl transferase CAP10 domain-containing protein n=1 Tax=Ceratocystis pirilliformis TaxID=259994 RepID=A0ABR3ZJI1_9PEZI
MTTDSRMQDSDKPIGGLLSNHESTNAVITGGLYAPTRLSLFRGVWSRRRKLVVVSLLLAVLYMYSLDYPVSPTAPSYNPDGTLSSVEADEDEALQSLFHPPDPEMHPVMHLVNRAESSFQQTTARQSQTLEEAVATYRRRYGIPPPPHFDTWFNFASESGFQLIDEFDTIYHNLRPFWGLKPETIRKRTVEALGYSNDLLAVSIRNGEVTYATGSRQWQTNATVKMISKFVKYLPDMDLAFNINDEPKIHVQHDDMTRLLEAADARIAKASQAIDLERTFSQRPEDMGAGRGFLAHKTTRFNEMSRQRSWSMARMSCSPNSPARSLEEDAQDDLNEACYTDMCFVANMTAFSDVCRSPSLATSYGFFVCPNAFAFSNDLIPIFSQSKYSTTADILYPSPWYWVGKVKYNETEDQSWENKADDLYWRGSTTGGFSRLGGWRHQHRQKLVEGLAVAPVDAKVLTNNGTADKPAWIEMPVVPPMLVDATNVSFSHIGQCDTGDCTAQKDFFKIEEYASREDGWAHKFLLDMDGNAFSGRFYSFLQSNSLPLKYAIAHEWHSERIMAWLHYVPLSLQGKEWWELLRWLRKEKDGREWAKKAAVAGQDWANKALRQVDMEVWFFRLLLEYGRVIDDDREKIGFYMA